MLPRLSGQAQDGAALGASAEDVSRGIGGQGGLLLALEFGGEAKPRLVFPPTLGNVAGEKAIHGPDQQSQRQEEEDGRDHRQDGDGMAEDGEDGCRKEQDQLGNKQSVVQRISAVASVEKAGEGFTKFHRGFLFDQRQEPRVVFF